MSTHAAGTVDGGAPPDASAAPPHVGRILVLPRVREKVVQQVAADTIGIPRGTVSVEVHDGSRGLSIRLRAPLPVPSLDDTQAIHAGPTVVARATDVQREVADAVHSVLSRDVARVDLIVSGALIAEKKRVK